MYIFINICILKLTYVPALAHTKHDTSTSEQAVRVEKTDQASLTALLANLGRGEEGSLPCPSDSATEKVLSWIRRFSDKKDIQTLPPHDPFFNNAMF